MRPITPRGFRDVLFQEAAERYALAEDLRYAFLRWGYRPVETPAVEEAAVLEAGMGSLEGMAFRLVDVDGRLLALRPEMTVPIARVAVSRLGDEPGPLRISYEAEVFREEASLTGQARQFTQAGVELIGLYGPAADAEVVSLLIESLRVSGLAEFTVALGTVEVLVDVLRSAGAPREWAVGLLSACHDGNLVELDRMVASAEVPDAIADALTGLPRLRGGREAIERARELAGACDCAAALDGLEQTWALLEAAGLDEHVTIDLGLVRDFGYYTGIVVEAYAPGLGVPLGGGGRYDGLLAAFGRPAPAAGFALGLDRLHIALAEQGVAPRGRGLDAVVTGGPRAAFLAAARLREAGWNVWLSAAEDGRGAVADAEELGAPETLLATEDGRIVRIDREGEPSLPLEDPLPLPPTLSWASHEGGVR